MERELIELAEEARVSAALFGFDRTAQALNAIIEQERARENMQKERTQNSRFVNRDAR